MNKLLDMLSEVVNLLTFQYQHKSGTRRFSVDEMVDNCSSDTREGNSNLNRSAGKPSIDI